MRVESWISYQLTAKNAHGLHSPFLFKLYNEVLNGADPDLKKLIPFRYKIYRDKTPIIYEHPVTGVTIQGRVGHMAKRQTSSHHFSSFLVRLINWMNLDCVLETGTSFGINTIYLAHSNAKAVITLEGSDVIAKHAQNNFQKIPGTNKIRSFVGMLKENFNILLQEYPDLIFLDADHTIDATRFCIEQILSAKKAPACIVLHDIYWSSEMRKAWKEIVNNPRITLTVDIFQAGLIFPNLKMEKQHAVIRF